VSTAWSLVGRDAELGRIEAAINDASCGGVVLIGPAGVGKTRLAKEAVELAVANEAIVRSVRATEAASSIPFAALGPLLPEIDLGGDTGNGLFRSAAAAVDKLRGDRRLVLMVDDAHELDDASVTLLDQLVSLGSIFVVLTVRTSSNVADAVQSLWKDERIVRVDLAPLGDEDMGTLASNALGPVAGGTLRALVEASRGNVLFLRELVHGGLETGTLVKQLGIWRLTGPLAGSPRLQDLIGSRLRGLSTDERAALELVALGDPLPLPILLAIVSDAAVEAVEEKGLLETCAGENGTESTLAHPLYGEVVRLGLPISRRARLSRALADATEAAGAHRARDVLRVAVWRLDGGGGTDGGAATEAARLAFRSGDFALAGRLSRAAWRQWGQVEAAQLLGQSLDYLGRNEEAEEVLAEAWPLAADDHTRATIALRRAANLFRTLGRSDEANRVLDEASAAISDRSCRRELDALQGNHLLLAGEVARAIELSLPLLAEPGDSAFAQASLDTGTALALAGRTAEATRHTSDALAARLSLDDEAQLSTIGVYTVALALALGEAGRLDEAIATAEAGYRVALEQSRVDGQAWLGAILARMQLLQGRLVTAARLFREAAALFESLGHPGRRVCLGGAALAVAQQNDRAAGQATISALDEAAPTPVRIMDVDVLRGRAWVLLTEHHRSAAERTFWQAADLAAEWGQRAAEAAALHDLLRIGSAQDASKRLLELTDTVDGDLMAARAVHARAIAAGDLGLSDEASARFEAIGARLLAAEAAALERDLAARAGLHRRSSAAGARVQQLLAACEGADTPALSSTSEIQRLSAREREVAMLAGEGLSSRQISERLVVSIRTVDNHLQRVYAKLGITGRADLIAVLGRDDD
jgi:DNA-binding CsgD family transcriptional regulator/tetratricopeptide (TPR) repeat protein